MGLMYIIMNCGCIYSAGILNESKLVDPSISYCCNECYQTMTSENYYSVIYELSAEIEQYDIADLMNVGWTTGDYVKEHIRNVIGKNKIEEMWRNAKEIYERY